MTEARVPSIVKDYSNENLKRKRGSISVRSSLLRRMLYLIGALRLARGQTVIGGNSDLFDVASRLNQTTPHHSLECSGPHFTRTILSRQINKDIGRRPHQKHPSSEQKSSVTGTRTLVTCVRGKYANHLHHNGNCMIDKIYNIYIANSL